MGLFGSVAIFMELHSQLLKQEKRAGFKEGIIIKKKDKLSTQDLLQCEVRKSNVLIQKSRFDLTLQQQKILLFLIAQLKPTTKDFQTYTFSIRDFCTICGMEVDSGRNYKMIKNQIKEIADKSVWLDLPDREVLVRLIEKPTLIKESGCVEIRFDKDMLPFLLQLKSNYTRYELVYILRFGSKYSLRLYEYIKSVHYNELEKYKQYVPLDDLKRILGAETYSTYKDLSRRVLSPAVNEINLYSDKLVSITPIKQANNDRHERNIGTVEAWIGSGTLPFW